MQRRHLLTSLATMPSLALPQWVQAQTTSPTKSRGSPGFTLVLGGGSAKGFAHIGVLKALQENNLVPDTIIGTSAGALVGCLFASGMSAHTLELIALKTKELDLVDFSSSRMGTINGFALQNWVNKHVRNMVIEQFPIRFITLATNLRSWQPVYFTSGNAGIAVRASSSIPGVFVPVSVNGADLVDGGLISPMPARYAKSLKSKYVLSVDVSSSPSAVVSDLGNMFEIVMHSFDIMVASLTEMESKFSDFVLKPEVSQYKSTDFTARSQLIAAGYEAAKANMSSIKEGLLKARAR